MPVIDLKSLPQEVQVTEFQKVVCSLGGGQALVLFGLPAPEELWRAAGAA